MADGGAAGAVVERGQGVREPRTDSCPPPLTPLLLAVFSGLAPFDGPSRCHMRPRGMCCIQHRYETSGHAGARSLQGQGSLHCWHEAAIGIINSSDSGMGTALKEE